MLQKGLADRHVPILGGEVQWSDVISCTGTDARPILKQQLADLQLARPCCKMERRSLQMIHCMDAVRIVRQSDSASGKVTRASRLRKCRAHIATGPPFARGVAAL